MKKSFVVVAVVALGLAGNASAKGNGGNTSSNSAPAPHHGSAPAITSMAAPHFNGVPHYSGAMPYRATVSYRNGNRTLNYPPVGNSVLRHQLHSSGNSLNSGFALQHAR